MAAPYYTGDDVKLKFGVAQKGQRNIKVTSATISLSGPKGEIWSSTPAEVDNDVVRMEIGGGVHDVPGDYIAEFKVGIAPDIKATHRIKYRILQREPIFSNEIDRELMPVDEESSDYEIQGAIGSCIRRLRRMSMDIKKVAEISNDLASKMTNRRM